jgi:hypothetical protein
MAKEVRIEIVRMRDVCTDARSMRVVCSFTIPDEPGISRDDLFMHFVEALKYDCANNFKAEISYSVD